jgi:hypothetical protein
LLEGWRPWYLSLVGDLVAPADNVYGSLAREAMDAAGLPADPAPGPRLGRERRRLEAERAELERDRDALKAELDGLRNQLEEELLSAWPGAAYPYTLNFKLFLENDLAAAQAFLLSRPAFPRVRELQDEYWRLDDRLLDNERALSRLEKIEHLRRLAQARTALEAVGPEDLLVRYRALLRCESAPF